MSCASSREQFAMQAGRHSIAAEEEEAAAAAAVVVVAAETRCVTRSVAYAN